jgi:hypothetical protein
MSTTAFQTIPKRKLGNSNLEVSAIGLGFTFLVKQAQLNFGGIRRE